MTDTAVINSRTGSVTFSYSLANVEDGRVLLEIISQEGAVVRTIDCGTKSSGAHTTVWDGKDNNGQPVEQGAYAATLRVTCGGGATEYLPLKRFEAHWSNKGIPGASFVAPRALAFDADGNIYIADVGSHRIIKYDKDYHFILAWGGQGTADGQFSSPYGVAVAPDNTVYVADYYNHRIQRFDTQGNFLGKWGQKGSSDGYLYQPNSVAVDTAGRVYVGDSNGLQRFDANGAFIGRIGGICSVVTWLSTRTAISTRLTLITTP
jgi:sugar lactone lactonase YvrE